MPSPGVSTMWVGTASCRPRSCASETIVFAVTCFDACSREAASRRASLGDKPCPASIETMRALPSVSVPVLSSTTELMRAIVSNTFPPLIRMPCRAARERPETIATGTARMRGQGVATTSTATARIGSPVTMSSPTSPLRKLDMIS